MSLLDIFGDEDESLKPPTALEAGKYWAVASPISTANSYALALEDNYGDAIEIARAENQERDEQFWVIKNTAPITVNRNVLSKLGIWRPGDNHQTLGIWPYDGPSMIHTLSELSEEIKEGAKSAVSGLTGLAWGVAAVIGGVLLLKGRR